MQVEFTGRCRTAGDLARRMRVAAAVQGQGLPFRFEVTADEMRQWAASIEAADQVRQAGVIGVLVVPEAGSAAHDRQVLHWLAVAWLALALCAAVDPALRWLVGVL